MRQWFTGVLLVTAALALWHGWPDERASVPIEQPQWMANVAKDPASSPATDQSLSGVTPSSSEQQAVTYQSCKVFLRGYAQVESDFWQQWSMRSLANDDDDVEAKALALYHVRSSNAAAAYKLLMLRRDAGLTLINQRLQQKARAQVGDRADASNIVRQVPHSKLRQALQEGTMAELQTALLLPDDVAWLIAQNNISDQLIRRVISAMGDINAVLGSYPGSPPFLRIIDVAARAGRVELVTYLLDIGALPSSSPLLPTTLDATLAYLSMALRLRDKGDVIAIAPTLDLIKRLIGMGQHAGFILRDDGSAVATFHARSSYFYDQYLQDILARDYGFFIDQIPRVDFRPGPATRYLRNNMQAALQRVVEKVFGKEARSRINACHALQQAVWDDWTLTYVDVTDVQSDNMDETLSNWFQQSPILTSCYRNQVDKRINQLGRKHGNESRLFKAVADDDIQAVLAYLASHADGAERWFYEIILYRPSFYGILQSHGYAPYSLTYSMLATGYSPDILNTFRALHAQGVDLSRLDKYGRSLLYVAARRQQPALLRFLAAQYVPYYQGDLLPDALYLWLWRAAMDDKFEHTAEAVTVLMNEYAPPVTEHHRQLMAAIDIKHPELYQYLTSRFPILEKGMQSPPEQYCAF